MTGYRVPFEEVEAGQETERFDPGPILARVVEDELLAAGPSTVEGTIDTPWGKLAAERRGEDELVLATPAAEVTSRQVLLNVAAMKLGIEKTDVEEAEDAIKELDVGERVLACPLPSREALQQAPADADPGTVPGVEAEMGVAYAVTQTSPYTRIVAVPWGPASPMTVLAAAAMHLVVSERFRPTYPRTRVVGQLLGQDDECEITVEVREAGGGPVVERVLVGGTVEPADG